MILRRTAKHCLKDWFDIESTRSPKMSSIAFAWDCSKVMMRITLSTWVNSPTALRKYGSNESKNYWSHLWLSERQLLGSIRPCDFILAPMAPLSLFPSYKLKERVAGCIQLIIASCPSALTPWSGRKKSIVRNALLFATLLCEIGSEKKPFE